MLVSLRSLLALVLCVASLSAPLRAQQADSTAWYVRQDLRSTLRMTVPLVSLGLIQSLHNKDIRALRNGYIPTFRHHYDDYLQFAPMAVQLGMSFGGLQGVSRSPWQALTADAFATATMLALTSAIKYTAMPCARITTLRRSSRG